MKGSINHHYVDDFFKEFEGIYLKHKIFNNTPILDALKHYSPLIEKCNYIQRISEDFYITEIENKKYSFQRKYEYDGTNICWGLCIQLYEDNKETTVYDEKGIVIVDALFSILNTMYNLNNTSKLGVLTDEKLKKSLNF